MKPQSPSTISSQDQVNKSFNQVLNGNVSPGNGLTFDSTGQPLTYSTDNTVGSIIRIGSVSNPNALPNNWAAANADTTITHNLGKVPYGFIVIAKYAAADVWMSTVTAPTKTTITLQTSNDATDISIWILC